MKYVYIALFSAHIKVGWTTFG